LDSLFVNENTSTSKTMRLHRIPDETIRRLPTYLQGLLLLSRQGHTRINSRQLAERLRINPPQIRKDLSYFGDFGTPGVGYDIDELSRRLREILSLDRPHRVALVGYGNLGAALLKYPGFGAFGFEIVAVFDRDRRKIGRTVRGLTIRDNREIPMLRQDDVRLAILAIPADGAQDTAEMLVAAGVQGILNFAPEYSVYLPNTVKVITMDIGMDLARLPYYVPVEV